MANFYGDVNLNKNKLQNFVIDPLSSFPNNPKAGQMYFDTGEHFPVYYNGANWVPINAERPAVDSITTTTTWTGSGPYTQVVTLNNYSPTSYSKIDLQPNASIINQLILDGVQALYIENNLGVLTLYAIGASPSSELTLQVSITEVDLA